MDLYWVLITLPPALRCAAYGMLACGVVYLGSGVDLAVPVLVLALIVGAAYGIGREVLR